LTNKPVKISNGSFGLVFAGVEELSADESQGQDEREIKTPDKENKKVDNEEEPQP
jgi:hypothetical protein